MQLLRGSLGIIGFVASIAVLVVAKLAQNVPANNVISGPAFTFVCGASAGASIVLALVPLPRRSDACLLTVVVGGLTASVK